jgi:hypothetical protein
MQSQQIALPGTGAIGQRPDRRRFLWGLAALGTFRNAGIFEKGSEQVYRFQTSLCEVRMSIEYFAKSSVNTFRFRDQLTNRPFCLSASGEQDGNCLKQFVGSMAIAHYHFRPRLSAAAPLNLRERVMTIDHDDRVGPREPFEKVLAVERATVSDIQAFGYDAGEASADPPAVWYLLRQDLFLNDQATAFLVVHWKHTFDVITLMDVIPGDGTRVLSD